MIKVKTDERGMSWICFCFSSPLFLLLKNDPTGEWFEKDRTGRAERERERERERDSERNQSWGT